MQDDPAPEASAGNPHAVHARRSVSLLLSPRRRWMMEGFPQNWMAEANPQSPSLMKG